MQGTVHLRYSVSFKRQVVSELESGRFGSLEQARRHYGIGGSTTVRRWVERLGANRLLPKVVRVEKPDEASRVRQLQQEVRQLKQALGQTQLEKVLAESYLQIACDRLGEEVGSFKKKADTKQSASPKRRGKGR